MPGCPHSKTQKKWTGGKKEGVKVNFYPWWPCNLLLLGPHLALRTHMFQTEFPEALWGGVGPWKARSSERSLGHWKFDLKWTVWPGQLSLLPFLLSLVVRVLLYHVSLPGKKPVLHTSKKWAIQPWTETYESGSPNKTFFFMRWLPEVFCYSES